MVEPMDPYGGYAPPPPAPAAPVAVASRASGARRALVSTAVVAAVVGGVVGAVVSAAVSSGSGSTKIIDAGIGRTTQSAPADKVDGSISGAAATIGPSVVTIRVSSQQEQDTGSGVIIRPDGYVLTNNHVISAAASSGTITVTLTDGRTSSAKIVGSDASDDLAVIKIGLSGLTAATFGSSSSLVVGQTVVAVGAPLGLSNTVTSGIVSDIGRPVSTGDPSQPDGPVFNAIQTDAAINPGNSGGPLVDLAGHVVGINAAIASSASGGLQIPGQAQSTNIGIGYAIPSDTASRIASELIATGHATHALMGVTVQTKTTTTGTTATVAKLVAGGPAAKAGLRVGDVVTKLDDELVNTSQALVAAVRSHAPGATVTVTYQRGSQTRTTSLTLGSAPS